MTALNARRILRERVSANARRVRDVSRAALEDCLARAKTRVRETRKIVKRYFIKIEKKWWVEIIEKCRVSYEKGMIMDMYKSLRKIGIKEARAVKSSKSTVRELKEHFERLSKGRYEEDPSVIARVIERLKNLREDRRARIANYKLNEKPERDEIGRAVKKMKHFSWERTGFG